MKQMLWWWPLESGAALPSMSRPCPITVPSGTPSQIYEVVLASDLQSGVHKQLYKLLDERSVNPETPSSFRTAGFHVL